MVELAAIVVAVLRAVGFKDAIFQACAHLLVGGLFGAWLARRDDRYYLYLAIALTVVEVVAFVASRVIA